MLNLTDRFLTEYFAEASDSIQSAVYQNPFMPVENVDVNVIKAVINEDDAGELSAYDQGSTIQMDTDTSLDLKTYNLAFYGGGSLVTKSEIQKLNQTFEINGNIDRILADKTERLLRKAYRTMTKLSWDALSGTATINYKNGETASVDYEIPAAMKPTSGNAWNASGADPISDLAAWFDLFTTQKTGYVVTGIAMNGVTFSNMIKNSTRLSNLFQMGGQNQVDAVNSMLPVNGRGVGITIEDKYTVNTAGTVTKFIPDGKVIIMGGSSLGDTTVGKFVAGQHIYTDGDDMASTAFGPFLVKGNASRNPISQELIGGFNGLPVLKSKKRIVYATAY